MPHTRQEKLTLGREIVERLFKANKDKHTIGGWVARDKNGGLLLFREKPLKTNDYWYCPNVICKVIELDPQSFPEVKWEEDAPHQVDITIELKK